MQPVVLLPNGRLRVPHVEHDPDAGGLAHTVDEIGPEDPDYSKLRPTAVTEEQFAHRRGDRAAEQQELDRYLDAHQAEGDAMLHLLQLQAQQRQRPAS